MSETNPTPYYDDEISISELLMKLWAKRGIIVMLPLVLAGLTLVALLMGKTNAGNTSVSFYVELNGIVLSSDERYLVSDSEIVNGAAINDTPRPAATVASRYPNGMLFSPQDVVNPSVLRALAEQYDVSSEDLAQHIDVQFGTPISDGVLAEYKAALAASSNGSAQDLAALNARYEDKLGAAAKRGLKITVDFVGLEISPKQGSEIATSLPKQWNRVYTQQFNTTLPSEISNLRWTDTIFDLSKTLGLQEADIQLQMLKKGTQMLSKDSRLRGLKSERGSSAADLSGYIDDFRAIFFEPLYLGAFETSSSLSRVYERDIRRQIAELDEEIGEVSARLSDIRNFQAGAEALSKTTGPSAGAQLDGSALSAVVNLAEQAALSSYLQESLDMRFKLTRERVKLKSKLARLASSEGERDASVSMDFRELASARYVNIVDDYSALLITAQAMLQKATPSYYAVITQPNIDGHKLLVDKRDLLYLSLALALGGMLAIIAALLWPQKQ